VREPFAAGFTCERERAEAPCTPLRPMVVTFTAPVPRKLAEHIVLKTPSGPRARSSIATMPGTRRCRRSRSRAVPGEGQPHDRGAEGSQGRERPRAVQCRPVPIKLTTAALPPLAKFAAAPFGVVERFADVPRGKSPADYPPLLPVTLRNVEADLPALSARAEAGTVARLKVDDDGAILRWFGMVKRMHENSWTRQEIDAIRAGQAPSEARAAQRAIYRDPLGIVARRRIRREEAGDSEIERHRLARSKWSAFRCRNLASMWLRSLRRCWAKRCSARRRRCTCARPRW
jgi:hypothetical protein